MRNPSFLISSAVVLTSLIQTIGMVGALGAAQAQDFRMERRDDRARHERYRDIGTGIGILRGVIETSKTKDANPQKRTTVRQKGPKDGKKKNSAKQPEIVAGNPPTPVVDDPASGIDVPGGTVHRGSGDYGGRQAIYCWVDTTDDAKCKDFGWYQFYCVEIAIDMNDGNGPQDKTQAATGKPSIPSKTGSYLKFGEWGSDEYTETKGKPRPLPVATGTPCPQPKAQLKGGAYYGAYDIPGKPKLTAKQKAERLKRLIDSPSSEVATDDIVTKTLGVAKTTKSSDQKPPDGSPFDIVITYHFRTALYCDRTCLGYFDWTFVETTTVTPTWVASSDVAESTGTTATTWKTAFSGRRKGTKGPEVGKWQACP